jgi:SNF2 family DNA or RNA helicase
MRIKKILNPEIKRTLVIAQQNLLNQWIEEAAKIGINLRRINKKTSGEQELEDADYITHFEFIKDNYRKYTDKFNLIILDEGHKIKTGKAQRGIAIRSLQAKYKMCLTGTPIKNIVKDLHFLMGWVFGFDSSVYPYKENEQHKFRKDYGVYEIKNGHRRLIPMASNIEELQYLVAPAILRRSISETGVKMVKNSVYRIGCDFTPEQLLEYERIKESDINPTSKRHEFCKITTIYPGNEKLELLKRLVRSCIVNNEQVIVFTGIVDTGLKYKEIFGDNARLVNGLLTPPVQERLINEFKAGEYPVLIGGLEAVNTGHSLQNASNVIVTDYPWTASTLDQAIARIFRIVSKKDVRVYLLYTKGSNDEDRMNLINIKREGAGEVLDREKYYTDIHIDYRSLQIQK